MTRSGRHCAEDEEDKYIMNGAGGGSYHRTARKRDSIADNFIHDTEDESGDGCMHVCSILKPTKRLTMKTGITRFKKTANWAKDIIRSSCLVKSRLARL
jgi:hypothetical protein